MACSRVFSVVVGLLKLSKLRDFSNWMGDHLMNTLRLKSIVVLLDRRDASLHSMAVEGIV